MTEKEHESTEEVLHKETECGMSIYEQNLPRKHFQDLIRISLYWTVEKSGQFRFVKKIPKTSNPKRENLGFGWDK